MARADRVKRREPQRRARTSLGPVIPRKGGYESGPTPATDLPPPPEGQLGAGATKVRSKDESQ